MSLPPIRKVEDLFCPACFMNRMKLSSLKSYFRGDEIVVYECSFCKIHWSAEQIEVQLQEIKMGINTGNINSYKGKWNFLGQSTSFQNNTLRRVRRLYQ